MAAGRNNPFAMPSDAEVFALRDEEKLRKEEVRVQSHAIPIQRARARGLTRAARARVRPARAQERKVRATQKIWEKGAVGKARPSFRQVMGGDDAADGADAGGSAPRAPAGGGVSLSLVAAATRERRPDKEKLSELINKKREMFLVQMALDTKRLEIRKLEERAQAREEALKKSEAMLEDDVNRFDKFLKQNDTDAVEAMRKAEVQTKLKADKVHEIKKLNAAISAIRSEMSKYEEQLDDCQRCALRAPQHGAGDDGAPRTAGVLTRAPRDRDAVLRARRSGSRAAHAARVQVSRLPRPADAR